MPKPFKPPGNSARLRVGRSTQAYGCYAITKVTQSREPVLASDANATVIIDSLQHLRRSDRIKLFAYCVMPDHIHAAFCLLPGEPLPEVVGSFSKHTSRLLNKRMNRSGRLWQEGFHDRQCRNRDELASLCDYIEHNPVRAGLVTSADRWPYCSAASGNDGSLDREWWP